MKSCFQPQHADQVPGQFPLLSRHLGPHSLQHLPEMVRSKQVVGEVVVVVVVGEEVATLPSWPDLVRMAASLQLPREHCTLAALSSTLCQARDTVE